MVSARPVFGEQDRKHDGGEDRAHRVVDDRLPFQEGRGTAVQPGLAQHRGDDGRPGDDGYGAEQRRTPPAHAGDQPRRQRAEDEAERQRQHGETQDALAGEAQLTEFQPEPALENDDGDRQPDQRREGAAEILFRLQPMKARSHHQPDDEKQHDRRQAQAPGDPLRRDPRDRDAKHRGGDALSHRS